LDKKDEIIYIKLLDEVIDVWRPTMGIQIDDFIFLVLPTEKYESLDEEWEFPPGTRVRCRKKMINGHPSFVAFEEVIE
jgi:hypothetical protein